jgi:septum formation protein
LKLKVPKIILASASPRRKYLLEMLLGNFGLKFTVEAANIAEHFPDSINNLPDYVSRLAGKKASVVASRRKAVVIGADTVVLLGSSILNKPESKAEAKRMLSALSGKTHTVITGIAFVDSVNNTKFRTHEKTRVTFRKLTKGEIDFYVEGGSPMDKAGAYGIQDDFGSTFVSKINGDYFNVVGLPIVKTYLALNKFLKLRS